MRRILVTLGIVCVLGPVSNAYAGKPERDRQEELEPVVAAAAAEATTACGCPIKITVKYESYSSVNTMFRIDANVDSIKSSISSHCSKEADKKAVCANLSEFVITANTDKSVPGNGVASPVYKDKVITTYSGDSGYNNDSEINAIMDKW